MAKYPHPPLIYPRLLEYRRNLGGTASILSGEFVALGINAITYYSTLRHLVLARLLVISKSRPSIPDFVPFFAQHEQKIPLFF